MLISAKNMQEATEMAKKRNLKPEQWIYVPWDTEGRSQRRRNVLAGRVVDSQDELAGYFSSDERRVLLRKVAGA